MAPDSDRVPKPRPDPAEFERCVHHLCMRIETLAMREGVLTAECSNLQATLAAMPPSVRDPIVIMLNEVETESGHPAMAFAARYICDWLRISGAHCLTADSNDGYVHAALRLSFLTARSA
jgi:hypothetical protein